MPPEYVKPDANGRYDEAAHRICDDLNTVLAAEGPDVAGEWMIFALRDGRPWMPAERHQHYPSAESACAHWKSLKPAILYQITPDGATPRAVAIRLKMMRQAWDNGYRIVGGTYEAQLHIDVPMNLEDLPR